MGNSMSTTERKESGGQHSIVPESVVVDDKLKLTPLYSELAEEYFKLVIGNQDRLSTWFSWAKKEQTMAQTEAYLERVSLEHRTQESVHFGVFLGRSLIGQISLTKVDLDNLSLNISGWIDKNYEGKGYFFKVAEATLDFVFNDLGFHRVEARAVSTNERSHNLIGILRKEGVLREAHKDGDRFLDIDVYGLLKSEWTELKAGLTKNRRR